MITTADELLELISILREQRGDLTDYEVKRGYAGVPKLGPTLSAFGNMPAGGTIVVGLDESQNFTVTGVADLSAMRAGIASQARQSVTPEITVGFHDFVVNGAHVLVANVSPVPLEYRPCRYQDRAYLRQADGDYAMSDIELALLRDRQHKAASDDAMWTRDDQRAIPDSGLDDLDDQLVDTLIRNVRNHNNRYRDLTDELILRDVGATNRAGQLTVAGAYVLGRYPQRFVPSWSATAAVNLPSGSARRTRDLAHYDGPLIAMYSELTEWVRRNSHTTITYRSDGNAYDEAELPPVAVRELIANALVHRDLGPYSRGKEVDVRLTNDRLIIRNPGGLRGITTAQLGRPGGRHAVNETVYRLCERLSMPDGTRLIEAEGGGIREARQHTADAGLRPLVFHDTGVSFVAIVSRLRLLSDADLTWLARNTAGHRLDQTQTVILASMSHGLEWTNRMVREEFDRIDSRAAQSLLQDLVARDLAIAVGEFGGTHYKLAPRLPSADSGVLTVVESESDAPTNSPLSEPDEPSANEAKVLHAINRSTGGATVAGLVAITELTSRQVRYALGSLQRRGRVVKSDTFPARWKAQSIH